MKTPLVLAALLLASTAIGAAVARDVVTDAPSPTATTTSRAADRAGEVRFAGGDARRDHDRGEHRDRRHHRSHHDDDDDDDDHDGGRGAARLPVTGPTDPATPVPDNGLFQGKARPTVQVN